MQQNRFGEDPMIPFIGVVEDRFDPLLMGRLKVRTHFHHCEDKQLIPTEMLPWAEVLKPADAGENCVGPKEGDWVFGYFIDGPVKQRPLVIGVWNGIPERPANPDKGFYDPRPDSLLVGHKVPRDPLPPVQHDDGSGTEWEERSPKSRFPDVRFLKESRVDRMARHEHIDETIVEQKKINIDIGQRDIPTANHPAGTGSDVASPGDEWTEAETKYDAKYPYNHVYWSEGGHYLEVDDTPGAERLHKYHRIGTFEEIHPDGSQVEKIVNDLYQIVLKRRFTHIEAADRCTVDWFKKEYVNKDGKAGFNWDITVGPGGDLNITTEDGKFNININGDMNVLVNGVATVEVMEDAIITVHGNLHAKVDGSAYVTIDGDANVHVGGNATIQVDGDLRETVLGNCYGFVAGDKKQVIGGDYILSVGGDIKELAGGEIQRVAGGNIEDITASSHKRLAAVDIVDTAPVIFLTAPLVQAPGELLGITLDDDGDITPPGVPGIPPVLDIAGIPAEFLGVVNAFEAQMQEIPSAPDIVTITIDSLDLDQVVDSFIDTGDIFKNPNAPTTIAAVVSSIQSLSSNPTAFMSALNSVIGATSPSAVAGAIAALAGVTSSANIGAALASLSGISGSISIGAAISAITGAQNAAGMVSGILSIASAGLPNSISSIVSAVAAAANNPKALQSIFSSVVLSSIPGDAQTVIHELMAFAQPSDLASALISMSQLSLPSDLQAVIQDFNNASSVTAIESAIQNIPSQVTDVLVDAAQDIFWKSSGDLSSKALVAIKHAADTLGVYSTQTQGNSLVRNTLVDTMSKLRDNANGYGIFSGSNNGAGYSGPIILAGSNGDVLIENP